MGTGTFVTDDERIKFAMMVAEAQKTPVMAMSCRDMMEGRDWASLAWDRAMSEGRRLIAKYGFDPETHGINTITGEIVGPQ